MRAKCAKCKIVDKVVVSKWLGDAPYFTFEQKYYCSHECCEADEE